MNVEGGIPEALPVAGDSMTIISLETRARCAMGIRLRRARRRDPLEGPRRLRAEGRSLRSPRACIRCGGSEAVVGPRLILCLLDTDAYEVLGASPHHVPSRQKCLFRLPPRPPAPPPQPPPPLMPSRPHAHRKVRNCFPGPERRDRRCGPWEKGAPLMTAGPDGRRSAQSADEAPAFLPRVVAIISFRRLGETRAGGSVDACLPAASPLGAGSNGKGTPEAAVTHQCGTRPSRSS